jgi:hypothetical protein
VFSAGGRGRDCAAGPSPGRQGADSQDPSRSRAVVPALTAPHRRECGGTCLHDRGHGLVMTNRGTASDRWLGLPSRTPSLTARLSAARRVVRKVLPRRRGLRAALAVGGRRDPGEDGAEQSGVEVGESVGAEMGDQDGVDVAGVVEPGGRPDAGAAVEPVSQPAFDCPTLRGAVGGAAGQPRVASPAGGRLRWIAAAADAFPAAEQVSSRTVEVPGAVPTLEEPWARLLEPPPVVVTASAPLEDHTWTRHLTPPRLSPPSPHGEATARAKQSSTGVTFARVHVCWSTSVGSGAVIGERWGACRHCPPRAF